METKDSAINVLVSRSAPIGVNHNMDNHVGFSDMI